MQKALLPYFFLCKSRGKQKNGTIFFLYLWILNHIIGCQVVMKIFFELSLFCLNSFIHNYIIWHYILTEKLGIQLENVLEGHSTHFPRRASGIFQGPYSYFEVPYILFCCPRYMNWEQKGLKLFFNNILVTYCLSKKVVLLLLSFPFKYVKPRFCNACNSFKIYCIAIPL